MLNTAVLLPNYLRLSKKSKDTKKEKSVKNDVWWPLVIAEKQENRVLRNNNFP